MINNKLIIIGIILVNNMDWKIKVDSKNYKKF